MSDKVDTYSVECECGTCQMLRDSVAPSCGGCSYRHNEVVALTAENEALKRERAETILTFKSFDDVAVDESLHLADTLRAFRKRYDAMDDENTDLRKAMEEAKNQPCPVCIARRGIDKCRPDEALHVTHYTAEEMNMDPLPDKPCECGIVPTEVEVE